MAWYGAAELANKNGCGTGRARGHGTRWIYNIIILMRWFINILIELISWIVSINIDDTNTLCGQFTDTKGGADKYCESAYGQLRHEFTAPISSPLL